MAYNIPYIHLKIKVIYIGVYYMYKFKLNLNEHIHMPTNLHTDEENIKLQNINQ